MESFCLNFCVLPGMCFLIGSSWLFICFTEDAANDLLLLNINGKLKRNRAEAKRRFLSIVRLYTDMEELSVTKVKRCTSCSVICCYFCRIVDAFNIIYEFRTFVVFVWTISGTKLNKQYEHFEENLIDLIKPFDLFDRHLPGFYHI